jgi:predicted TPR repeat methyltransferase
LENEDHLVKIWNDTWLTRFNFTGARLMEYGIGAGLLGKELFRHYRIHSYVGVDISQKSLDASREKLKDWTTQVEFVLTPQRFSAYQPSMFVSQAVIQHFPSLAYFDEFLANVHSSGALDLMLQVRFSNETVDGELNKARRTSDMTMDDVQFALLTNADYMEPRLPRYDLLWQVRTPAWNSEYLFTGWRLK